MYVQFKFTAYKIIKKRRSVNLPLYKLPESKKLTSALNWLIPLQSYPRQRTEIKDHFTICLRVWKLQLSHTWMYKTLVL